MTAASTAGTAALIGATAATRTPVARMKRVNRISPLQPKPKAADWGTARLAGRHPLIGRRTGHGLHLLARLLRGFGPERIRQASVE